MKKILIVGILIIVSLVLCGNLSRGYELKIQEHTVTGGETLWSIASKYYGKQDRHRDIRELIWEIRELNKLDVKRYLQPGDYLKVPLWIAK